MSMKISPMALKNPIQIQIKKLWVKTRSKIKTMHRFCSPFIERRTNWRTKYDEFSGTKYNFKLKQ